MSLKFGIVGGGSSAHILANVLSRNNISVTVFSRKSSKWNRDGITMIHGAKTYIGAPIEATNDYKGCQDCDVLMFCCPVSVELDLLQKIKKSCPHMNPKILIGTIFGQSRFDKRVEYVFGRNQACFAFIKIPFICRTEKYGESVINYGDACCQIVLRDFDIKNKVLTTRNLSWVKYIHTDTDKKIHFTWFDREWLYPSNNVLHPGINYGRFLSKSKSQYFYRNLPEECVSSMEKIDNERVLVTKALNKFHNFNVNTMSMLNVWNTVNHSPGKSIGECLRMDDALKDITVDPNIHFNKNHRFFNDDITYGLCYIKYLASKLNVTTPFLDEVITWAQQLMGKEYINKKGQLMVQNLPKYFVVTSYHSKL